MTKLLLLTKIPNQTVDWKNLGINIDNLGEDGTMIQDLSFVSQKVILKIELKKNNDEQPGD